MVLRGRLNTLWGFLLQVKYNIPPKPKPIKSIKAPAKAPPLLRLMV